MVRRDVFIILFFLLMQKERTKESAPRSITLPSASARYTGFPATASAKVSFAELAPN